MIANATKAEIIPSIRKAAILLIVLGDATGADVLKQLSDDEVQLITSEVARVNTITSENADLVLEEFHQMISAREYVVKGGLDYAKRMLHGAYGPEVSRKLIDRLVKALGHNGANFGTLHKADPQQLAKFIHSEHPQTIALILSHLNPSQAAALLVSLPVEIRSDVALRMANLDQISPEIITKIANVIGQKLQALGEFSRESYGGVRAVAELFNRMDSGSSKEILEHIADRDPGVVETIRHLMFVFDDLMLLDPGGMKEVVAKVDRKVLTVALKGTSDQLRHHFTENLSARAAEMLRDDMENLGPVKIKDVEQAQQQIINLVRQLEADGVVSMKGAVGERYVV